MGFRETLERRKYRLYRHAHAGQIRQAQIDVRGPSRCQDLAEWQVPLVTNDPIPRSFVAAAGGHNEAKSRRESRQALTFFQHLEAIVEKNVADPVLVGPT